MIFFIHYNEHEEHKDKILHTRRISHCILFFWIVFSGVLPADAEVLFPKLGSVLSREHPTWQALDLWQQELAGITRDRLVVQLFPEAQLGTAEDILYGLRFGHIEMGVLSSDILVSLSPSLSAVSMPYIFYDDDHKARVLDGPIGKQLLKSLQHANVIGLEFFEAAPRGIFTFYDSLNTPEDLQGLTIGSALGKCDAEDFSEGLGEISQNTFAVFGATVMPVCPDRAKEVLDSGTIDGWEGKLSDWGYFSDVEGGLLMFAATYHTTVPDILVVSKHWFDSLPSEDQAAIRKASHLAAIQQRKLWFSWVEQMKGHVQKAGIQMRAIEQPLFEEAVQPIYQTLPELDARLVTAIQVIQHVK